MLQSRQTMAPLERGFFVLAFRRGRASMALRTLKLGGAEMTIIAVTLATSVLLIVGFAAGFMTREMMSRRKRLKIEKMEELWK